MTYMVEAFTLLGVALLITALRTYSRLRIVGIKRFEADDYLVLVGAVSSPCHILFRPWFTSMLILRPPDISFPRNRLCIWQRRHRPRARE